MAQHNLASPGMIAIYSISYSPIPFILSLREVKWAVAALGTVCVCVVCVLCVCVCVYVRAHAYQMIIHITLLFKFNLGSYYC